jgi:hypothetical protein
MNRAVRGVLHAAPLAALTALATVVALPSAGASGSGVPFTDSGTHGTLTFCNQAGQPMTSGSLANDPFAWKVVSSTAAPKGYGKATSRATLLAFQPIQYIDPGDWSGQELTAGSSYSNVAHPVVQETNADEPLLGFVQSYPPHWDHLIQLRMYFSGLNQPEEETTYPAAVLRISGNTWTMVQGGGASCSSGTGVSDEKRLLPKKYFKSPTPVVPAGESSSSPTSGGSHSPGAGSGGTSSPSPGGGKGSDPSTTQAAQSSSSGGMSTGAKTAIGLGLVALIGLAVAGIAWWRRRPAE